jgi:hypothetical protein
MKMVEKKPLNDAELDGFFAAARDVPPVVSEDFMARILADALAELPPAPVLAALPVKPERGWIANLLGVIGGWPAAAGLATATVAGLMIGMGTPETLDQWTGGYLTASLGYQVEDLLPTYDDILGEG